MEEYIIMQTMVKFDITYDNAERLIMSLQRKDLLTHYFNSLSKFKTIQEVKKYYDI